MLFLAITLGFLVENRREHYIEHMRAKEYAALMHEDLKKDYEKLYKAYYSYDKKILKLLEGNPNVIWAEDSSGYVMNKCFSFYKKPRMQNPYFLWLYYREKVTTHMGIQLVTSNFHMQGRIDTLRPHQIFCFDAKLGSDYDAIIIAPSAPQKFAGSDSPDSTRIASTIEYGK